MDADEISFIGYLKEVSGREGGWDNRIRFPLLANHALQGSAGSIKP